MKYLSHRKILVQKMFDFHVSFVFYTTFCVPTVKNNNLQLYEILLLKILIGFNMIKRVKFN